MQTKYIYRDNVRYTNRNEEARYYRIPVADVAKYPLLMAATVAATRRAVLADRYRPVRGQRHLATRADVLAYCDAQLDSERRYRTRWPLRWFAAGAWDEVN